MPNNDEKNDQGFEAAGRQPFEQDTERAFTLPKPTPERTLDDDNDDESSDGKQASSAIDDLEIEVEEDELEAESESPGRKY